MGRFGVFTGVVLAMLVIGGGAQAASVAQEWKLCQSDDAAVSIAACTTIIKSGHKTQTDKSLAQAYTYRGNGYVDKGELHEAIADFNQAVKLDPKRADAFAGRGVAYYMLRDYQHAKQDLDVALQLNPGDALNWAWRSRAKAQLNDAAGANADMARAHEIEPQVEDDMPDDD